MRIFHLLLIILAIIPSCIAASFHNYDISYDASSSKVTIDTTISLENKSSGLDFSIFTKPSNIHVDSSVPINYKLDETNGYKVLIDFIQPQSGDIKLSISFTANLIQSLSDRNIFSMGFQAPLDINKFSIKLLLPETSQIYYQDNQPFISPKSDVSTDGKRIIIIWSSSLNQNDSYIAIAGFSKTSQQIPMMYIILSSIIVVSASIFFMWTFLKKRSHKPIITSMSEDEREIFNMIHSHKNITQEQIREKSGYSKSKISKLIRNLEKMDVIIKTPYKKTNKLQSKL